MKKLFLPFTLIALMLVLSGCSGGPESAEVTLMLDWVPNVNHTGIFVAESQGYFEEAGLAVNIIQPGEVYAEQAVATGAADFGISFQEYVTLSRADEVPIVSIAAIIQHNTSGFASRADMNVTSPADFEGLVYGSFGTPFEEPTLNGLMGCAGRDYSQLEVVDTGFTDPLALLDEEQIDLAWIFFGTQGFLAQQQGVELNVVMMDQYFDCIPDYYTPVFIASEETIANRPETVRAFLQAISKGYQFAIENPDEAAGMLLEAAPELDEALIRDSQAWLSARYQADAPRWGEQKTSVWEAYTNWMVEQGVIDTPIDSAAAFTNDFLP